MVDERQRVIQDLLVRLSELGIEPEQPFDATFIPGEGWSFAQESREPSSSLAAGVANAPMGRTPLPR